LDKKRRIENMENDKQVWFKNRKVKLTGWQDDRGLTEIVLSDGSKIRVWEHELYIKEKGE